MIQAPDAPTGNGSAPSSPASGTLPHAAVATAAAPDTPAAPEGLGDELASVQHGRDELEFEKRQHELEVETWSRQRKEKEGVLACRGAQLDARA